MPITTDLDSEIGQLRLLIGDNEESGVKPDGGHFSDAEISYFLEKGGGVTLGAALACETLAWLWNQHPTFEADGLRVERGSVANGWWRAAVQFRANRGAVASPVVRHDAYSK